MESIVSVIVPVYNVASYLPACIDSVLAQTFADFELLLVDDGSTDGSGDICDDYACRDVRVTVLHQPNAGPAAARNAALDVAQGEYVAFVDSDDVIHRQYLEVLYRCISTSADVDIVQSPYKIVSSTQREQYNAARLSQPLTKTCRSCVLDANEAQLAMLYQCGTADSSPCKLFRRRLFDGLRFPVVFRVYEDLYLLAQLYPRICKMIWVNEPLYFYFKSASGTLNSLSTQRRDAFDVLETLEAQFLVTGHPQWARAARERRLSVAFNILRLLSSQEHTDANKTMAHLCWQQIKKLRAESIRDPKARFKNRAVAALSYLIYR